MRIQMVAVLVLSLVALNATAAGNQPRPAFNVPPEVSFVSSAPAYGAWGYRVIVTTSEIYKHVFVDKVATGLEGSDPKVVATFAIADEDLNGRKYSVKFLSELQWADERTLTLLVNEKRKCRITLRGEKYETECSEVEPRR